jgi:hypothetical protein
MEHLRTPEGAEPIDVPYVGTEEYDGREFMSYPKRLKWTDYQLVGGENFGNRSPDKIEAFFQTWLYFGCLISVFADVGLKVTTKDFIRETSTGEKYVTTGALPKLIEEWKNRDWTSEEAPTPRHRSKERGKDKRLWNLQSLSKKSLMKCSHTPSDIEMST